MKTKLNKKIQCFFNNNSPEGALNSKLGERSLGKGALGKGALGKGALGRDVAGKGSFNPRFDIGALWSNTDAGWYEYCGLARAKAKHDNRITTFISALLLITLNYSLWYGCK